MSNVSDEKIGAAASELVSSSCSPRCREHAEEILRHYFQPKPKPPKPPKPWTWPERTPYPEDWVSVEEWLPDDHVRVLFMSSTVGVNSGYVTGSSWWLSRGEHATALADGVTHWCALKEPLSA